jgi:ureidoacrylate peracid hydrolase
MVPDKTAVVLIEYQNDFTSEGGTLHAAVKPVMESTNITFVAGYGEISPEPYGILTHGEFLERLAS